MADSEGKRRACLGMARHVLPLMMLAVVVLAKAAAAQTVAARLAIVVQAPEASQAGELLTVELSQHKDVQLLERSEIDRIYREQQLSVSGKDYLRLGQVLGADGLILLEPFKAATNMSLGLSFIAVKPGVLLTSERFSWSTAGAANWAAGINRHLSPLLSKATVLRKDAVPISIVSLRSAVQSPEGRDLEHQLTLLLGERLSHQRELFVLERRNLQVLTSEKALQGLDDSSFWSGSFLLEGTLDPEGYSPQVLTIRARLVPPRGGTPQTMEVSCSRTNPAAGVENLATRVLAALKLQSTAEPWNAAEEGDRFFADANWAYRWGLLAQAQAASESAWALGRRTEPLAALRIQAYADAAVPVWTFGGNIYIPGLPDPVKLNPLLRALELFNHDCELGFTNGARLNEEWYFNGLRLFRWAIATLDGYYHWAELTEAHQAQITELRSQACELLELLDTKPPMDPSQMRARFVRVRSETVSMNQELGMFDLVKWNEGGLLFERPEDSLPLFRSMLEQGYAASNLPRIIGWQWEQRKTVPKVLRGFMDGLCASTNPATRLGGLTLKLAHTPFYPEITFHERENVLVGALWDCRDWVLSTAEHAAALGQTETILRHAYGDEDVNVHFTREPFAGARYQLEREFLLSSTNFDNRRFQIIFPPAYLQMPSDQARDLAAAMEHLVRKDNFVSIIRDRLRARGGLPPLETNAPPVVPVFPAEEPLTARFVRWKQPPGGAPGQHAHFERLLARDGRLWALITFLGQYETFSFHGPRLCVSVDPQSGSCDEFPFPERLGQPDNRFEVTKDSLYVSFQDHLERFHFANRTWERAAVPIESGASILSLGNKLYLSTGDSILEFDPSSLATRILGSARRQPPASDLDPVCSSTIYLYARKDGNLGVLAGDKFFAYEPTSQILKKGPEIPPAALRAFKVPFFSPEGVLLRTESTAKWQLLAFWNDAPSAELLAETFRQQPGVHFAPRGEYAPANPSWEWPAGFDLNTARVLAQSKNLWILTPRKVWHHLGIEFKEPARFSDARQATLFYFTPGSRAPLAIPIAFESSAIEPFNPRQGGFDLMGFQPGRIAEAPFWLDTPAGLVFSAPTLGGHWLIPRPQLEQRVSVWRAKASTDGNPVNPFNAGINHEH